MWCLSLVVASAQIGLLKSEIEEAEGTPACRQDLLVLREGDAAAEEGSAVPLADDFVISDSCTIALIVAVEPGQHAFIFAGIFRVLYFYFSFILISPLIHLRYFMEACMNGSFYLGFRK